MNITEVQIELASEPATGGFLLLAYARVMLDDEFLLHDLKVMRGPDGLFVSMPQRPHRDECLQCGRKTDRVAGFCMWCGTNLGGPRPYMPTGGRPGRNQYFADIIHPTNRAVRDNLERTVLQAFEERIAEGRKQR